MTARLAAVTGGTGFLGRYIVAALREAGWRIRLLTRRTPLPAMLAELPLEILAGELDDPAALSKLVHGADAVIHCAGLVKARRREDFFAVNEAGTRQLAVAVAATAPQARFVLISSQAARAPHLSAYAASKRAAETTLAGLGAASWVVLRPCVTYGPWDMEGVALLHLAGGWLAPVPARPEPRIAMINARDVAAAVLALAHGGPSAVIYEISDARTDGYGLRELLLSIGIALGRTPRFLPLPDLVFRLVGGAGDGMAAITGRAAMFGRGKARELLHRDWAPDPAMRPPPSLWSPLVPLPAGLAETVAWWREQG